MENNGNEKTNYGAPDAFPLMGSESKLAQGGYASPQGAYAPLHGGNDSPQGGYRAPPPSGAPITNQPVSQGDVPNSGWMNIPQTVPNCPPGLEYLFLIDQLIVNREPNLKETVVGWVSKNSYVITNSRGEKVYYAAEVSECCSRNWCGSSRAFVMKIMDNYGHEVISMTRPLACQHCCCPCCLQSIEISSPPGTVAGVIEQQWSIFYPSFLVKNGAGDVVLQIKGLFCGSACCADVNFMILSADGKIELGKVYKKFL